jgi:hypothetical protein
VVTYDAKIVTQFAEQLYAKAKLVLIVQPVLGAVLGAAAGWVLVSFRPQLGQASIYGLAVLFALVGFSSAQVKAFAYRLDAQRLLVQAKIEENTRR